MLRILATAALLAAFPSAGFAQQEKIGQVVFAQANSTRDGYANSNITFRYRFENCAGWLTLTYAITDSFAHEGLYFYKGKQYHINHALFPPPEITDVQVKGVVRVPPGTSFSVDRNFTSGHFGCAGNVWMEHKMSEFLPPNRTPKQEAEFLSLAGFTADRFQGKPVRNYEFEKSIDEKEAEERRVAEQKKEREAATRAAQQTRNDAQPPTAQSGGEAVASSAPVRSEAATPKPSAQTTGTSRAPQSGTSPATRVETPAQDYAAEREAARKARQQRQYDSTMAALSAQQTASQRKADQITGAIDGAVGILNGLMARSSAEKERREAAAEARRAEQDARVAAEIERRTAPYRDAAAAGDAEAQYRLYEAYSNGVAALGGTYSGHEAHTQLAHLWLERAALQGHRSAQTSLGDILLSGYPGYPHDVRRGVQFSEAAHERGAFLQPRHVLAIANVYWCGAENLSRNVEESERWALAFLVASATYVPPRYFSVADIEMFGRRFRNLEPAARLAMLVQTTESEQERAEARRALAEYDAETRRAGLHAPSRVNPRILCKLRPEEPAMVAMRNVDRRFVAFADDSILRSNYTIAVSSSRMTAAYTAAMRARGVRYLFSKKGNAIEFTSEGLEALGITKDDALPSSPFPDAKPDITKEILTALRTPVAAPRSARADFQYLFDFVLKLTPVFSASQEARANYLVRVLRRSAANVVPAEYSHVAAADGHPMWSAFDADSTSAPPPDPDAPDLTAAIEADVNRYVFETNLIEPKQIGYVKLPVIGAALKTAGVTSKEAVGIFTDAIESVRAANKLLFVFDESNNILATYTDITVRPPSSRSLSSPDLTEAVKAAALSMLKRGN